jgi:hypothetical protein
MIRKTAHATYVPFFFIYKPIDLHRCFCYTVVDLVNLFVKE